MATLPARLLRQVRRLTGLALFACSLPVFADARAASAGALPGVDNAERARTNYILRCQGCHGPNGEGSAIANVPAMWGFVGNFLRVEGGRTFLVQVPGVATTALADPALAELLNWLLPTISGEQLPPDFAPYTADEVGTLRKTPAIDVAARRAALIDALAVEGISEPRP